MNECLKLQQQIDDYLSDRISDFDKRRIENHLRQCSECASEIEDYRSIIEDLRSASREASIEPSYKLQYALDHMADAQPRGYGIDQLIDLAQLIRGKQKN